MTINDQRLWRRWILSRPTATCGRWPKGRQDRRVDGEGCDLGLAALLLFRDRLFSARPALWLLMLMLPLPYIANTTGWMTAELGRQPWLVYGILRTAAGVSPNVSAGNGLFVLLGFLGMYAALGILALFLVAREVEHGPESPANAGGDE